MTSWLTWPVDWLARKLSERRIEEIESALSDARYVDETQWARLRHISKDEAREELEMGVKAGALEKMFLYESADSPITFLVPENLLDKPIRLSEFGDFSESEDRQIVVSRLRSRPVYVAAGTGAEKYVNAA
jgi:hypothetical protein